MVRTQFLWIKKVSWPLILILEYRGCHCNCMLPFIYQYCGRYRHFYKCLILKRKWVFARNSDFLIPVYLHLNFQDISICEFYESRKFVVRFSLHWRLPEGILFHWRGLKKCFFYMPLEGFICPSWGVILPLEGFSYPS